MIDALKINNRFSKIASSIKKSITTERFWDFLIAIPQGMGVMTQTKTEAAKEADGAIPESIKDLLKSKKLEAVQGINDLRSAELFLRDCGLSRTASKAFISRMKSLSQIGSEKPRLSNSELY